MCFNRTKVECKYGLTNAIVFTASCFNRTKVECKYSFVMFSPNLLVVLIEPKWNVNHQQLHTMLTFFYSFNRTKVECKFLTSNINRN